MDIAPLYELRTRLKHAVISGSDLITEDFRLERAVSEMKPLEAASPVFAKIGQLTRLLLSGDCTDRPGRLLDAITLVDAVICTQGVVHVPGELQEIKTGVTGSIITNAPHSILSKLLDALEKSGSGRYAYVIETHQEHPELFEDYRVTQGLVKALGASYAELAEEVAGWLKERGESILPLLKEGFDPKGKKEMVRRVQVIEAVAKEKENAFYLEQLETAQKEVKQALIYALRHTEQNLEYLTELTKTEKGNTKKMAYWAIASMDHKSAREFWTAWVKKNPKEALPFLAETDALWASDLVAEKLKEELEPWIAEKNDELMGSVPKKTVQMLRACLVALPGKTGSKICECYRMAAQIGWNLTRPMEGENVIWSFKDLMPSLGNATFREAMPQILYQTIRMKADRELGETAIEIWNTQEKSQRTNWFPAAFSAQILFHTEAECKKWIDTYAYKDSAIYGKVIESEGLKREIERTFRAIWRKDELSSVLRKSGEGALQQYASVWYREDMKQLYGEIVPEETSDDYVIWGQRRSPVNGQVKTYMHPLPWSVQGCLTDLIMNCKDQTLDMHLGHWIQPDNLSYCEKLEQYFYRRARVVSNNRDYLRLLKRCGSQKCEGLAERYFGDGRSIAAWEVQMYLRELPGGWREQLKEITSVRNKVKEGKIKIRNKQIVKLLDDYIKELKTTGEGEE